MAVLSALGIWSMVVPPAGDSTVLVLVDGWLPALLQSSSAESRTSSVTTSLAARGRQAVLAVEDAESDVLFYWVETIEQSRPPR